MTALENTTFSLVSANRFDVLLQMEQHGVNLSTIFPGYLLDLFARYKRVLENTRNRAQKKIYFWWIPICYDPKRDSGKRMMHRSWEETKALYQAKEN
jgi:hypothetical protein